MPAPEPPTGADLRSPERIALTFGDAAQLAERAGRARKALQADAPAAWRALRAQGVFRGRGPAPKVAFLYTGQGSQYPNMLARLRASDPIVSGAFDEADRVMTPILGRSLSSYIFVEGSDRAALAQAEEDLRQTSITQPAVLAVDTALTRLLAAHGITPDLVMGHSLGEYAALVASGALPFEEALEAVAARGREMAGLDVPDPGWLAAVFAPAEEVERSLAALGGGVVIANHNSRSQVVIGGPSAAVAAAMEVLTKCGHEVVRLSVSHAFHTPIVAPASEPLRRVLSRLHFALPRIPLVANVTGELYPTGPDAVPQMLDLLSRQVASPVRFAAGLRTLHALGARLFVEVGPKKALHGFVEDVFADDPEVVALFTNHPKNGELESFDLALCGCWAAGVGAGPLAETSVAAAPSGLARAVASSLAAGPPAGGDDRLLALGHLFAEFLDRGLAVWRGTGGRDDGAPVVVTGAALGLPAGEHVFSDANVARILHGEQMIDVIPQRHRHAMVEKNVTRLVKSEVGGPSFERIESAAEVIKLAARAGRLDLAEEFGVPVDRVPALDVTTRLAIAAGLDALRDAGIPLSMHYRTTSKGTRLPDRWMLPDGLRDETGVIFAAAFPGLDAFADELDRYHEHHARAASLADFESLRARIVETGDGHGVILEEVDRRIHELRGELEAHPYAFDRRFLFRVLAMGHSQFAELIGARGPNTHLNAACASTTQAVAVAEDWIRSGRCRRVVVLAADDVTSEHLLPWMGAGFLATGAAATDELVEEAALPFDRRRHGMILGMGAAAIVIESAEAARERGLDPICEVLAAETANSAFHGTRLDVEHIGAMMERLVARAEARGGVGRAEIAPHLVFVSHETYTPARGGSAAAEVQALRRVFGARAAEILIANTKGFTGHPMGVGIEDVVAIKALETGIVPPVPNHRDEDPELGPLHLSRGGAYDPEYALRLGAGFGSQISMTLSRRVPARDGARRAPDALGYAYRVAEAAAFDAWLRRTSGLASVELETVKRTLRLRDMGSPSAVVTAPPAATLATLPAPRLAPIAAATPVVPPRPAPLPTAPTLASPAAASPAAPDDPVHARVLEVVAEKTGYPIDMLDLDLDLEADLGIDTVKQAETFAAIRESYGIPRDEKLRLRDFPTLAHVIGFVKDRRPDLAPPAAPAPPTLPASPAAPDDSVRARVLEVVAEKTGYPIDMLDLDLDLEADLGIDTVKQAETFAAIRESYGIPRDEKLRLRDFPTLAHVIGFVKDRRPDLAPPAAPAPPTLPASPAAPDDPVRARVLEVVAEKTGYPIDMLDLDLDLEADLGIDTVKQAETFAAIRESYGIPRDEKLRLRDFPTLAHVIGFVKDRRPDLTPSSGTARAGAVSGAAGPAEPLGDAAKSEKIPRRVVTAVPRPPLDAFRPTGLRIDAKSRLVVAADRGGVGAALVRTLVQRGAEVLVIEDAPPAAELTERLRAFATAGAVQGVYWLPALDPDAGSAAPELAVWRESLRVRAKLLYTTMRALLGDGSAPAPFLLSGVRLGGRFGYDAAGALHPLGGAVAGFTKAYRREWPETLAKVVDHGAGDEPVTLADRLLAETERDPGAVEVGYADGGRWSVGWREESAGHAGVTLGRESVFVVSGAAGSIVSVIVADLAAASGGIFHLLDRVAAPDPSNPDLARVETDRDGLRRDLFERMRAQGERSTPVRVEHAIAELERAHAALQAIRAVEAAGGRAHWHAVDLCDGGSVKKVMEEVCAEHSRIDVLLHAAGLEVSRGLADKQPAEFDRVFDVKSDGWFNLLHGAGSTPIGVTVVFSSIAGRFGNAGQTDYAAANELLCKATSALRSSRPGTQGVALDWTAWSAIGMASRGSIPEIMERAGIDMLPPEIGVPVVRREIVSGAAEIIVAGRLGALAEPWASAGGAGETLDAARVGPLVRRIVGVHADGTLEAEAVLDPAAQAFLYDHRIDGTPVLPGVMGIELFAEVAALLRPEWYVVTVEGVDFLAPFKFYRDEPRAIRVRARPCADGDGLRVDCELVGERRLPGQDEARSTVHFTGSVRLAPRPVELGRKLGSEFAPAPAAAFAGSDTIYRLYFHGPAYRVLDHAWRDGDATVGALAGGLPANHAPASAPLRAAPRLLELCLQTAGVRELAGSGRMALPQRIARVHFSADGNAEVGARFAVVCEGRRGGFDAVVVDETGREWVRLEGYGTVAVPAAPDADALAALRAALG